MPNELPIISDKLIHWYSLNKRDLPWRDTRNPYLIWISEIILQQTRVVQGYDYYLRFTHKFPDVKHLAEAKEDDVLKMWQGLGYYSRARNLHAAAKTVMSDFDGNFPSDYKDILFLKGIGEYTAAAIASFSFDLPYAVVDGNVYRVLARLFAIDTPIDSTAGKKEFAELAGALLDRENPALYNQAIMEFGALQCTPVLPRCDLCPLTGICLAYAQKSVSVYPVKQVKTRLKERYFNYFDIRVGSSLFLQKRTGNDIWKNLYELPLIETEKQMSFEELSKTDAFGRIFKNAGQLTWRSTQICLKHVLSHRIIYGSFFRVEIENDDMLKELYIKVKDADFESYAISRLVHRYFEQFDGLKV